MPITLYVATTNPGKLRDIEQATQNFPGGIRCVPLPGLKEIPAPPEDAPTFKENAIAKAIVYSHHAPGYIVLADDSGLEVDAIDGAPGVRSARYAVDAGFSLQRHGKLSADESNNLLLLENLRSVPRSLRTGRYRCALAAARDGECIQVAEGMVEGIILEAPRGSGGFRYDPLFFLPQLGQSMAEINVEQKLKISHRSHALRALLRRFVPEI